MLVEHVTPSVSQACAMPGRISSLPVPRLTEFSHNRNGLLDNGLRQKRQDQIHSSGKWPSFNLSRHRAAAELDRYLEK
ncbi:hypothetical protein J2Z22_001253 [Paenibacillus forsythiae]|uniref:Uncharacterized protein n=1 Tax=Paenibacillus forsythiae TaxID=365616 RepID=A0ABU3H4J7_9BACL|nr:hypothetical protein [Paenibacillus forsythiae]MDT3425734.1 hypothetical protein [Paenibacillus forsythiae]